MPGIEKKKNHYSVYHKISDGTSKHKKRHLGSFATYDEAIRVCDIMCMIIGKDCRFKRMDDVLSEDKELAERIRSRYFASGELDVSSAAAELSTMNNKRKRLPVEEGVEKARETVALLCNWSKRMKRQPTEDELNAMVFVMHEQTRHVTLKKFNLEMNQQLIANLTMIGDGRKYARLRAPDLPNDVLSRVGGDVEEAHRGELDPVSSM